MYLINCKRSNTLILLKILVGSNYFWSIADDDGHAKIITGNHSGGDNLYSCRVSIAKYLVLGKLDNDVCFIPFDGKEIRFTESFETLKTIA